MMEANFQLPQTISPINIYNTKEGEREGEKQGRGRHNEISCVSNGRHVALNAPLLLFKDSLRNLREKEKDQKPRHFESEANAKSDSFHLNINCNLETFVFSSIDFHRFLIGKSDIFLANFHFRTHFTN